jgi:hypothetical protein
MEPVVPQPMITVSKCIFYPLCEVATRAVAMSLRARGHHALYADSEIDFSWK